MQQDNNATAVRLQSPEAAAAKEPSPSTTPPPDGAGVSGPNQSTTDGAALQVQAPSGPKSTMDMLKGMTTPDLIAGFALVVGLILVLKHFGRRKSGRTADENLAHLEQARLLAQAARYQAASEAIGERRPSPGPLIEARALDARAGEPRAGDDRLSRRIDERIDRLERLITEADRRIRRLEELEDDARGPRMAVGPTGAASIAPKTAPRLSDIPSRPAPAPASSPAKAETRMIEPRADATPDDWQSRTRQLAAAGLSPREIAFKLGKPIGHVELVLALQRGQIAG
ncbi:MAG: hypothetical protein JNL50_09635 [Phycisphaerae bacterium]|nr:hypothetical protein [Phycisphaerae bacterium]